MLKGVRAEDLKVIAGRGGSFHLDARDYDAEDLKVMAGRLGPGGILMLSHSECLDVEDMKVIAGRTGDGATALFL